MAQATLREDLKGEYPHPYYVRVDHELGFCSAYLVHAADWNDAEREAKRQFAIDFCDGGPKGHLSAYTVDKYQTQYKNQITPKDPVF